MVVIGSSGPVTGATGRVALVTGASSGIGAATARLLAARGMRVVVNYLHSSTVAEEVVAGIKAAGGQAMALPADRREGAAVESMIEQVQVAWGGIDVLVHNALTPYVIKPFQDMTWEELGGKLDDEMRAAFAVTKAVLLAMTEQGWGRIIYLGTGLIPGCDRRENHERMRKQVGVKINVPLHWLRRCAALSSDTLSRRKPGSSLKDEYGKQLCTIEVALHRRRERTQ
jgi:nucleoside-diphosphate-sugar epimerase